MEEIEPIGFWLFGEFYAEAEFDPATARKADTDEPRVSRRVKESWEAPPVEAVAAGQAAKVLWEETIAELRSIAMDKSQPGGRRRLARYALLESFGVGSMEAQQYRGFVLKGEPEPFVKKRRRHRRAAGWALDDGAGNSRTIAS